MCTGVSVTAAAGQKLLKHRGNGIITIIIPALSLKLFVW